MHRDLPEGWPKDNHTWSSPTRGADFDDDEFDDFADFDDDEFDYFDDDEFDLIDNF